jgi:tetratricopeptide (TPR) repeat protein
MTAEYPAPQTPAGQEAEAIYQQGYSLYEQQQFDTALPLIEQSLALYRQAQHPPGVLRALHLLANIGFEQKNYPSARKIHKEVLAMCRAAGIRVGEASTLNNLGLLAEREGNFAEGCACLEDSVRIYEEIGDEPGAAAARANLERIRTRQENM